MLVGVYVAPAYRGDQFGVTSALIEAVEDWASGHAPTIRLDVHESERPSDRPATSSAAMSRRGAQSHTHSTRASANSRWSSSCANPCVPSWRCLCRERRVKLPRGESRTTLREYVSPSARGISTSTRASRGRTRAGVGQAAGCRAPQTESLPLFLMAETQDAPELTETRSSSRRRFGWPSASG